MAHEAAYRDKSAAYDSSRRAYAQIYVVRPEETRRVYACVKRFFDLALAIVALVLLSPLFLLTAIAIKLENGGPVIYSQLRAGKNGRRFRFYKFRSMCVGTDEKRRNLRELDESDGPVFKISKDPRVTKVGRILRKSSVGELPQLINILKGEMAIVGPRSPLSRKSFEMELSSCQYMPQKMGFLGEYKR